MSAHLGGAIPQTGTDSVLMTQELDKSNKVPIIISAADPGRGSASISITAADFHRYAICQGLPKNTQGAAQALRRYDENNPDIPAGPRRLLAISIAHKYFPNSALEQASGQKIPKTIYLLYPWRWWNVLHYSGLGDYWKEFKTRAELEGVRIAQAYLKKIIPPEQFLTFLRRAGSDPRNSHHTGQSGYAWTKGGAWPKGGIYANFTKLLVMKEHLPERVPYLRWQHKLGVAGAKLVEQELWTAINPDVMFRHEARRRAIKYARKRLAELVMPRYKEVSAMSACWFFQCNTPAGDNYGDRYTSLVYLENGRYIQRSRDPKYRWQWRK